MKWLALAFVVYLVVGSRWPLALGKAAIFIVSLPLMLVGLLTGSVRGGSPRQQQRLRWASLLVWALVVVVVVFF